VAESATAPVASQLASGLPVSNAVNTKASDIVSAASTSSSTWTPRRPPIR
jgi:hypothetical protein